MKTATFLILIGIISYQATIYNSTPSHDLREWEVACDNHKFIRYTAPNAYPKELEIKLCEVTKIE